MDTNAWNCQLENNEKKFERGLFQPSLYKSIPNAFVLNILEHRHQANVNLICLKLIKQVF